MRQCFKCEEKFPDSEPQCPLCGHTRSFAIAGTSRIIKKSNPAPVSQPVKSTPVIPTLSIPTPATDSANWSYKPTEATAAPDEDAGWHPSGMRWAGITMVGILFPPLAAISFFGTETVFLLIIQWMAVLFGCFLIFELAWAEWLGGAFAMFTILKEVRGGMMSLALGHWLEFLLGVLVCVGLGVAMVMLHQGYTHPGTKKLVYPALGLISICLLLVFAGAISIHQTNGELPTMDPYSEHDRKTQEAAKFMEESIRQASPPPPPTSATNPAEQ